MNKEKNTGCDITFIGSGISSSFTLFNLLEKIEAHNPGEIIKITLIDKYPEYFCGIPYGARSGYSTLLITSLQNFLPEPELGKFITWLNANKEWLLKEFKKEGGNLSENWLSKHQKEIEYNQWKDIFLPRRFFGCYLEEKLNLFIRKLERIGVVKIKFVHGNVVDINKNKSDFTIFLKDKTEISSKKVVLAVGSLPTKYLWRNKKIVQDTNLLFINHPYNPSLRQNLDAIKHYLEPRKDKITNVLIIGANASGLEMLYKLNDEPKINQHISNYSFLSTQGLLPDSIVDEQRQKRFVAHNLLLLQKQESLTASEIAKATFEDLELAEEKKLGAASTVGIISSAFGNLLNKLDDEELKNFACYYGNEIGRRQRCAGEHYSETIDTLKEKDSFSHIAGRFISVNQNRNDEYLLEYLDTPTQQIAFSEQAYHLVINCVGGMDLSNEHVPILIKNLIQKKYVEPNESGIGLHVNESLESIENFHIAGPLLAGNIIENKAVWHVEHCGRIIWLSELLAKQLYNSWDHDLDQSKVKLYVTTLNSTQAIKDYNLRIKNDWNSNPYYFFEYFAHHENGEVEFIVFELFDDNRPLALMPMIMRAIRGANKKYFDTISPYGYSGPLFKNKLGDVIINKFWELIDTWYKENNVVTEFIRFSLNQNNRNYSGTTIASLDNVSGNLHTNFNEQWNRFPPKVRNNYRKAIKHDLEFKISPGSEITGQEIGSFYRIYCETMKRNNANAFLYFSESYFDELIKTNPNHFLIAFVFHQGIPISTELIIINNSNIHAFLGGTLSEYFKYRPNDYLRVEIIKWAIEQNMGTYILGGGIENKDSLYKSKKVLFPKDTDCTFYTGRKIINKEIYDDLCSKVESSSKSSINNDDILSTKFFPIYRLLD